MIRMDQDTIIDNLLVEYNDHRIALKNMIIDLEKIRAKIEKLFPDSLEKRYVMYFQEKIKAVTALFNSLLDMRKEIAKSVKDEIELRRKITKDTDDEIGFLDIREIAKKVESLQVKEEKLKSNLLQIDNNVKREAA